MTAEQQARDMLARMGVEDSYNLTAGELVELANLIAAAPQWQPIETAPDNMTAPVVVRWVNSEGEESCDLDYKEDGCWMGWHDRADHIESIGGHGVSYTPPYEHWMPLPAAPKE